MGLGLRWKCTGISWIGKGCESFVQKSTQTNKIQKLLLRIWANDWNRGSWFWFRWMVWQSVSETCSSNRSQWRGFCHHTDTKGKYSRGRWQTCVHPEEKGARIKVFDKCAGGWRWPKQTDEIDYVQEDIIHIMQKIQFPQLLTTVAPTGSWGWRKDWEQTDWNKELSLIHVHILNTYKPISTFKHLNIVIVLK